MEEQRPGRGILNSPLHATSGHSIPASNVSGVLAQAETLLQQRRWQEAEQLLRESLAKGAPAPTFLGLLVRTLQAQGKSKEARDTIDAHTIAMPGASPALLLMRAQMLLEMGELKDAIGAFEQAIAAAPDQGAGYLGLAVAQGQDGQNQAANRSAAIAISKGVDNVGSRSVLAHSFYELHRYDEAESEYRRALKHNPGNVRTHTSLAELVWLRTRDAAAALVDIDHAITQCRDARSLELQLVRVRVLSAAGFHQRAMEQLETLLAANPNHLSLRILAIKTSMSVDASKAVQHAAYAMRMAPGHTGILGLYGDAMLASGNPSAAAEIAQRLLTGNPHDNHAIALQTAAWRQLDDARHLPFHDYASLVQTSLLDVPDGWSSLQHYLDELTNELHGAHGLLAEPLDQSVRGGTQVELRADETHGRAVRAFPQAIHGPIQRYMRNLAAGLTPWHRRVTERYRLNGWWSVRLPSEGHHVSHYHGKGWVSSACYVQVPQAMNKNGGEGWLKFGEPGVKTQPAMGADYFVRPQPGMLVLFPSWMWHGTAPFTTETGEHRLSMAFDVVPMAG
nr:putative 2OG-Fe(II) oxygenase [Dyella sp. C11]